MAKKEMGEFSGAIIPTKLATVQGEKGINFYLLVNI